MHLLPQLPQLSLSFRRSLQLPLQLVGDEEGHWA